MSSACAQAAYHCCVLSLRISASRSYQLRVIVVSSKYEIFKNNRSETRGNRKKKKKKYVVVVVKKRNA